MLSLVVLNKKKSIFTFWKSAFASRYHMGGVSAIQETPSTVSMGSNTKDPGCHVDNYCESITEMQ